MDTEKAGVGNKAGVMGTDYGAEQLHSKKFSLHYRK